PPAATPGALSLAQRSAFMKLTQRRHDDLGFHALTEFSVNLARLHQSVASDDEFGGHRQEVRLIPVIFFKLYAGLFVERLNLAADPEDQSKRQRIAEVDVAKHRKRQAIARDVAISKLRAVRHDRDCLRAQPLDLVVNVRQRPQVAFAIRAPMPAVNADDHWPRLKQRREGDELSVFVRQIKSRHRLAKPRTNLSTVDDFEAF